MMTLDFRTFFLKTESCFLKTESCFLKTESLYLKTESAEKNGRQTIIFNRVELEHEALLAS